MLSFGSAAYTGGKIDRHIQREPLKALLVQRPTQDGRMVDPTAEPGRVPAKLEMLKRMRRYVLCSKPFPESH